MNVTPKTKAIKDLCQRSEAVLFKEVATGIGHVMDSVNNLEAATRKLYEAGHHHPARVLEIFAEEEAAKVLILVDAVRCPPNKQKERSRTLGYFYDHLAKGIYAMASEWVPADFAEVKCHVNYMRGKYYLDGPNDVDWMFPNWIAQRREEDLYVGYIRDDLGEHHWVYPRATDTSGTYYLAPTVIRLARTLHRTKATTPEGLSVIAEVWRPVEIRDEMRWLTEQRGLNRRTLEALKDRGLPVPELTQDEMRIWDNWVFPLWPLDLGMLNNKEELREIQQQWVPYGY